MSTPFVAFGNDELSLKDELQSFEKCLRCGEMHEVRFGNRVLLDGTKEPSKALAFVNCNNEAYLVGILGKRV